MNRPLNNDRGVALVLTLAILAILTATALQLATYTGNAALTTLAEKDRFQAEQYAMSGIHLAMLILVDDAQKNEQTSSRDSWADADKIARAVEAMGLDDRSLTIAITDELSKIQVNALLKNFPGNDINPDQQRIWENLLRHGLSGETAENETDPATVTNALKDWLDSGDDDAVSGLSGAESDYYLSLDPPYLPSNGPIHHINELFKVKGISPELLTPERRDDQEEASLPVKLNDLFTVYGMDTGRTPDNRYRFPGQININTAEAHVLAALLPEGMEDFAADLIEFREQKGEQGDIFLNLLDNGWYKRVIDLSEKEATRLDRVIRYSSDLFRVRCTAEKNQIRLVLSAVVKREKLDSTGEWRCRILQIERN